MITFILKATLESPINLTSLHLKYLERAAQWIRTHDLGVSQQCNKEQMINTEVRRHLNEGRERNMKANKHKQVHCKKL